MLDAILKVCVGGGVKIERWRCQGMLSWFVV